MRDKRRKRKGATLLEIVIALAIIGIMMLPFANSLLTSVKANKMGEELQQAKLLGQEIIENLKGKEAIRTGVINISGYEFDIRETISGNPSKLDIKSINQINGYELDGTLQLDNIIKANQDKHLDMNDPKNKLCGLIVVENNKMKIIQGTDRATSIDSILNTNSLTKYEMDLSANEKVIISMAGDNIAIKGQKNPIYEITNNNDYVLGIYVKESTQMGNLTIENLKAVKQNVYVFRNPLISKEDGTLDGKLTYIGEVYRASNIIYDIENDLKALYSLNLNIEKDNTLIESTNAQFYIGK